MTIRSALSRLRAASPFVTLAIAIACLLIIPPMTGAEVSTQNGFSVLQSFATYGVLALGLGVLMIAGEFDLSISAIFALGAMLAVSTGEAHPWLGALVALAAGGAVGAIQGGLVARLSLSSMSITVGGFIALLGLTRVVSGERSVGYTNYGVGELLDQRLLEVLSPRSLGVIALFALAAWLMDATRWGRDVRAVGGNRRAARTAGVRVGATVVGVFVASSAAIALAGASVGYSLASATIELASLQNLIYAATAALLGRVALTGGVGTVAGIAAGALSLSILQEILNLTAAPTYLSQLVTGALLLVTAAVAAPGLLRARRTRSTPSAAAAPGAPRSQPS